MTNRAISISLSSTCLSYSVYVAIFHRHLHMVIISHSWFDMQELVRHTINFFFKFEAVYKKQVDVTEISTVSFTGSFPQILLSLQQFSLPIQTSFGLNAIWRISYRSVSRSWHTDVDYGWHCLHDLEIGLTAGMTGRQGILTPHRYPILHCTLGISRGPCLLHSLNRFVFPTWLMRWMTVPLLMPFHMKQSKMFELDF
jgi:hypothetical protein